MASAYTELLLEKCYENGTNLWGGSGIFVTGQSSSQYPEQSIYRFYLHPDIDMHETLITDFYYRFFVKQLTDIISSVCDYMVAVLFWFFFSPKQLAT